MRNPMTKDITKEVYTVINICEDELIDRTRDIRKHIPIGRNSLGLSSLFVTFKSDVMPNTLSRIILSIGTTKVNRPSKSLILKVTSVFRRTDITAERRSNIVSTREIILANIFLISFFIVNINISIPDIRSITENMSEVSNCRKYSLSTLSVFIRSRIIE